MQIKFTLPTQPIAARLLSRLQDVTPVVDDVGATHVKDLQDNIINEGGDPDTGQAWQALSSRYMEYKKSIGAFLTILRRTDDMRKGITIIAKDGRSYRISVRGNAQKYFAYANDKRKFLGMAQTTKDKAKIRLLKHLKS